MFPPQVLDWCAAHGLHDRWGARPARWPSEQEWRADVGKRRAALRPLPTCLHALLQRLGQARAAAPCSATMAAPCLGAAPDQAWRGRRHRHTRRHRRHASSCSCAHGACPRLAVRSQHR